MPLFSSCYRTANRIEDARNGGASGCVETGAFGTEAYTLSGYFNLNKVLEVTMHNGFDPRTQKAHWPADRRGITPSDLSRIFINAFEQATQPFYRY
jgi:pyruvate-formate lyase